MYYCSAQLIVETNDVKLSIPSKWVEGINSVYNIKNGYRRGEPYKIFFSNDENDIADFNLETRNDFDENTVGCYMAYIHNIYCKFEVKFNHPTLYINFLYFFSQF